MSVSKLLRQIVAPDVSSTHEEVGSTLHDHTYGITSDPLTQFTCVFVALIHDVDHPGVPNTQLVKEEAGVARLYKNRSVAEQNSVDIAWSLFEDDGFANLRHILCATDAEMAHFRRLVVNS